MRARTLLALAIGSSTRQTYSSGVRSYVDFAKRLGIHPAFPASVQTLCLWLADITSPPRSLTLGTCKV